MDKGGSPRCQDTMRVLLLRLGYTPGSDEGRLKLQELMTMCMKLSKQVLDLEKEKDAQVVEILRLTKQVKRLEIQRTSCTSQPRRRKYRQVESSDDDLDEEDASKQGRSNDKTEPMLEDLFIGTSHGLSARGHIHQSITKRAMEVPRITRYSVRCLMILTDKNCINYIGWYMKDMRQPVQKDNDLVTWGDLKTLLRPNEEDEEWKNHNTTT
ncbi:hypothetical protein Tco_0939020 [Tanacetum coccineum]|uniref:Uncharacterized protein n=1 Tax=Tanacetum coccineum TaxID=301880 RepID=A0ABQ5DIU8_9ASTR